MGKITATVVGDAVKNQYLVNTEVYDDLQYTKSVEIKDLGVVEPVNSFGGEDEGSRIGGVFKFNNQYFMYVGYYDSWDGTDWSYTTFTEVFPYNVTKVEYLTEEQAGNMANIEAVSE